MMRHRWLPLVLLLGCAAVASAQDTRFNQLSARPIGATAIELQFQGFYDYSGDYVLKRIANGVDTNWVVIARIPSGTQVYVDRKVKPGTRYYYVVDYFSTSLTYFGSQEVHRYNMTNAVMVTTPPVPKDEAARKAVRALLAASKVPMAWVPDAPKLTAARDASGAVILSWNDPIHGEFGYIVERRIGATRGSWERLALVGPDTVRHKDTIGPVRQPIEYRVRAYYWTQVHEAGPYSNTATVRAK